LDKKIPRDELRPLLAPSNAKGWAAVGTTYAMIAFSFALVRAWPAVPAVLVAVILLGGRQLALAILAHEAAHKTLFASKRVNEWVGTWLCGAPMAIDLVQYRKEHMQHHQETGTPDDPDLGLAVPYPVSAASMTRKCLRDLAGITAVRRIYYILLIGFGFLTYTLSTNAKPIPQTGRSLRDYLRTGARNFHGVIVTNLILFAVLWLLGSPALFLLWIGAYFSTFSLFARLRSIAEHACTPDSSSALLNTRTILANPLARVTVAPHRVNYHLEHHLFMQVPYFNLPRVHELLVKYGIFQKACSARGYVEVISAAITR
jgi:fatty acid desaturase